MTAQPAPRPEDGATFHIRIQPVDDGRFRASCRAQLNLGYEIQDEVPEYFMADTEDEAKAWLRGRAAHRGFTKWVDDNKAQKV